MIDINKKIKALRLKHGFSQKFLAEKLKISRPIYINIEMGRRNINTKELKIIAELYNFDLVDILSDESLEDSSIREVKKLDDISLKEILFKKHHIMSKIKENIIEINKISDVVNNLTLELNEYKNKLFDNFNSIDKIIRAESKYYKKYDK